MNTRFALFVILITFVLAQQPLGIAVLQRSSTNSPQNLKGTVTFAPDGNTGNFTVTVYVTGLNATAMLYGIHVHQFGDLSDTVAGSSVASHFNPFNLTHGCPELTNNRHLGDMGNWYADNTGTINQTKSINLLTLNGNNSILGRAVQLHGMTDDCISTASSGVRLGFGVIGLANVAGNVNTANNTDPTVTQLVAYMLPTALNPNASAAGVVFFEKNTTFMLCNAPGSNYFFGQFFGVDTLGAPGKGLHVHYYGDLSNPNGTALGFHWNLTGEVHNLPDGTNNNRHQGDLGNVKNQYNGSAVLSYCDTYVIDFSQLIGRGIILHSGFDHGNGATCDQAGSSGSRYLTGVIGIANPGIYATNTAALRINFPGYINSFDSAVTCVVPPPPGSSSKKSDASRFTVISSFGILCAFVLALFL